MEYRVKDAAEVPRASFPRVRSLRLAGNDKSQTRRKRFTLHTDQAKLGGSPLRFTAARAACRPAGQPLWYNYVVPTPLLQPGSPELPFWQYLAGNCATMDKTSAFISETGEKPVPRPVINLEQSFLRPFLRLEALAFY